MLENKFPSFCSKLNPFYSLSISFLCFLYSFSFAFLCTFLLLVYFGLQSFLLKCITAHHASNTHKKSKRSAALQDCFANDIQGTCTAMSKPTFNSSENLIKEYEPKMRPMQPPTEAPMRHPILKRSKHSPILVKKPLKEKEKCVYQINF